MKKFILSLLSCCYAAFLLAAPFNSGSDGSDGALVFDPDLGDVIFDPDDIDPALDPDRDGVYHFTTITIGPGTTVLLRGDVMGHKPAIWLAAGDVTIMGEINLGPIGPLPGAGGFYGGQSSGLVDGQGPGGTSGAVSSEVPELPTNDYINPFLVPLIGGSGQGAPQSGSGLGGGGAFLLASSTRIEITGYIRAIDGGSLRLIANEITGEWGSVEADHIRAEAYQHNYSNYYGDDIRLSRPGLVFYDNPIKITVVDSVAVANNPGANKNAPDAEIINSGSTTIQVECSRIPLGTTIRVVGWNETYGKVEAVTGPLTGTLEASTATCEMIIPPGYTTFMAQAVLN
ncbi:hypothetical protein [Coraliomargarita parva]|uniref:hypothetical protein n=1 Tax=Coraliomargarita parva TaxID=3014050 RepID=UPI0022B399A4|nr:hypothetical protein [Coraliomargarita parva]